MKRSVLICVLLALLAWPITARNLHRGYRGFVDFDNAFGAMSYYDGAHEVMHDFQWFIGVSTSHGFQFNENLFVGGGLLLSVAQPSLYGNVPVFADFRYDADFGRFKPYADVRIGCNLLSPGLYFSPTVGHRFSCGRKANFNVGLGMMLLRIDDAGKQAERCFFALKLGFDF